MRYTKVNNQLIEKYTSLKITSTLPASGEDKEIVLVKGHGVYQYRTNTWVKVLNLEADVSSVAAAFSSDIADSELIASMITFFAASHS